jgi:hypothetical protein
MGKNVGQKRRISPIAKLGFKDRHVPEREKADGLPKRLGSEAKNRSPARSAKEGRHLNYLETKKKSLALVT